MNSLFSLSFRCCFLPLAFLVLFSLLHSSLLLLGRGLFHASIYFLPLELCPGILLVKSLSFFSAWWVFSGLSLLEYPGVKAIDPAYALPVNVVDRIFFGRCSTWQSGPQTKNITLSWFLESVSFCFVGGREKSRSGGGRRQEKAEKRWKFCCKMPRFWINYDGSEIALIKANVISCIVPHISRIFSLVLELRHAPYRVKYMSSIVDQDLFCCFDVY